MTADQIIADLKKKKFAPIYFLGGDEPYHIDKIVRFAEQHVLDESEKAFNQIVLYGKEVDFKQVVDNARQFPMMAAHRLVVLKEAQSMRDFDKLETYISQPAQQTILLISYKHKKPDGRKAVFKTLKKSAVYFESNKIKDYKLAQWILNYVKDRGYSISMPAAQLLAEYLGNNLQKIENEIGKATINFAKGQELTAQIIQDNIGISKEYNVYELQKALGQRQVSKVQLIADNMATNIKSNPMPLVVSSLYRYFNQLFFVAQNYSLSDQAIAGQLRVNPYFVKDIKAAAKSYNASQFHSIFQLFKVYDLKSKGLGNRQTPPGRLLIELVSKIIHAV